VIWLPVLKFVPETLIGRLGDPVFTEFGLNPVTVGAAFVMFRLKLAVPPPGEGFETMPFKVPAFAVSVALREKVMVFPATTPEALPREPVVPKMNPVPETVTVAGPDPAAIDAGFTLVTFGTGFDCELTVNVIETLVPPPGAGLDTDTLYEPAVIRFAGIVTVIDVELEDDGEKVDPPKLMRDRGLKLLPFKVRVTGPEPAAACVGARLARRGCEFCGVNWPAFEFVGAGEGPPPGEGF